VGIQYYLEAYDISNLQGDQTVGSLVVMEDGEPALRLVVNEDGKVQDVLTFEVEPGTGRVLWFDEHKMRDLNDDPSDGMQLIDFDLLLRYLMFEINQEFLV